MPKEERRKNDQNVLKIIELENGIQAKIARIEVALVDLKEREEDRHNNLAEKIESIRNNHLPSIYKQLNAQKTWLISLLTAMILLLITGLLNFFYLYLK